MQSEKVAAVLSAQALHQRYGNTEILRGLDLAVEVGEIYALLGGNGAGKSTVLNIFLGLIKPTSGKAIVCGHDVAVDPAGARAQLAYVPENVALYEHLDAIENISYFLAIAGAARDKDSVIAPALEAAGLAREAWRRRLVGYSKGMRQKVAIALAIARKAPVLLLDEPTSGLDPRATTEFNQLLNSLRDSGVTTLMVTHDLLGAADIADRIGFLAEGLLSEEIHTRSGARIDVRDLHHRYALAGEGA